VWGTRVHSVTREHPSRTAPRAKDGV